MGLHLRLASYVLLGTTATGVEWLSRVASVQRATTVLRDSAQRDHNSMSAPWDTVVRRLSSHIARHSYSVLSVISVHSSSSPASYSIVKNVLLLLHVYWCFLISFWHVSVLFLFCVHRRRLLLLSHVNAGCYMLFPWNKIQYNLSNGCSRAVSDRQPVFQAATSSGKVRVAVRCALLVSIVKIKVKPKRQIGWQKHFAGRILNAFWILSVYQEWHFHFSARKDFIVRGVQQINTPVQQGHTEICQGWLKNGSAHSVTLGCTVKRQVQFILCSGSPLNVLCCFFSSSSNKKGKWNHSWMKFVWRESISQWAMCCGLCLCWGSLWAFTTGQSRWIPVSLGLLLLCGHVCTKTMSQRNVQVHIPVFFIT